MSHSNRSRSSVVDAPVTADALADAQAATDAARIEADAAAHAVALGNAIIAKLADVAPAPIVAYTFEEARLRILEVLASYHTSARIVPSDAETSGLMAAMLAAAPPPPVHEDTCNTLAWAATQEMCRATWPGITEEMIDAVNVRFPKACNCKASKPKRASVAAHPRSTPVSTLAPGVLPVKYTKLDGTVVDMRYSDAARQAASDYPAAVGCAKYVRGVDVDKQSLNAQHPLRADAKAGNIPAIAIRFMADPAPEAVTPTA